MVESLAQGYQDGSPPLPTRTFSHIGGWAKDSQLQPSPPRSEQPPAREKEMFLNWHSKEMEMAIIHIYCSLTILESLFRKQEYTFIVNVVTESWTGKGIYSGLYQALMCSFRPLRVWNTRISGVWSKAAHRLQESMGGGGSITLGVILSSWNSETLPMGVDSSELLFFWFV